MPFLQEEPLFLSTDQSNLFPTQVQIKRSPKKGRAHSLRFVATSPDQAFNHRALRVELMRAFVHVEQLTASTEVSVM